MSYPEHPFIKDLSDLSDVDLQNKISEINKKLGMMFRLNNPNSYVINQMNMIRASLDLEVQRRRKKQSEDSDFDQIIDIS